MIDKAVTVVAVKSDSSNDEEEWAVRPRRHRAGNRYYSPDPARIPDDVREALIEWAAGGPQ